MLELFSNVTVEKRAVVIIADAPLNADLRRLIGWRRKCLWQIEDSSTFAREGQRHAWSNLSVAATVVKHTDALHHNSWRLSF